VTFSAAFAGQMRIARAKAGISQEEWAMRAEVHRTQISLMETGKRLPRVDTFVRLTGAVGLTPDELLGSIRWTPGVHTFGAYDLAGGDR
jgi:transcriptional regulator with XRE-family HTH domain